MIFNYDANKTLFHNKGFALSLFLKVRFFGTRKWPILHIPHSITLDRQALSKCLVAMTSSNRNICQGHNCRHVT